MRPDSHQGSAREGSKVQREDAINEHQSQAARVARASGSEQSCRVAGSSRKLDVIPDSWGPKTRRGGQEGEMREARGESEEEGEQERPSSAELTRAKNGAR